MKRGVNLFFVSSHSLYLIAHNPLSLYGAPYRLHPVRFMKTISTSSVLLAVVVAIVAFNAIAEATYPCAVTINNHTWNFSPLTSTKDIRGTDSEDNAYEYTMNLCGTVNTEPYCKDKRAMVCRAETQGMGEWIMASFESLPEPTWSLIDKDNMDGGLHLTLKNGETCRTQDGVVR